MPPLPYTLTISIQCDCYFIGKNESLFALEKRPLKSLSSGTGINSSMLRFTLPSGLSGGVDLSKGVPAYHKTQVVFCVLTFAL